MVDIYELEKVEISGVGYVRNKTIRGGTTTGLIHVPKRFVGQEFQVILIPKDGESHGI